MVRLSVFQDIMANLGLKQQNVQEVVTVRLDFQAPKELDTLLSAV